MRSDGKRVTREASRATGTFLFFPKGALTHHPGGEVVFPVEIVRSPRGMRLLRQPMDNAPVLRICCHCPRSWCAVHTEQNTVANSYGIPPTARTNLPPADLFAE